ncbi:MAG: HD domain-containing protein, partial [Alphaproteobacteria bacterium]|nr:HD domain-containing protein [Alphaproteobacteria bacterium]
MIKSVEQKVKELMAGDNTGHSFDHIERVYHTAIDLCNQEDADIEVVALAALLHDVDDYKLFGQEC